MSRASTVTTAKITRVLKALTSGGHAVARVELKPNGDVFIIPSPPGPAGADITDLDTWRSTRDARKAQGA